MILVLAVLAVVWGIGAAMGTPRGPRLVLSGGLLAGVIGLHLALPVGHPLREATGSDARLWLLIIGLGMLGWGYALLLRRVRAMSRKAEPVVATGTFQSGELDRYARHVIMREIGGPGQKKLKQAKVLVVGAGGLGSPVLLYLAAAGVGTIGVIDDDAVDATNLQRQVIHSDNDIDVPKVQSAADKMKALNPFIEVKTYHRRLTEEIAEGLIADYDLVLDGSDNFKTRYLVNAACAKVGKPLVAAAITQWEGQMSTYDPARGGPCYRCVFPEAPADGLVPTCAEAGVAGPLPGVIGSMMALEAVKEITGAGEGLRGRLLLYDGLFVDTRVMSVKRRPDCPDCGSTQHLP